MRHCFSRRVPSTFQTCAQTRFSVCVSFSTETGPYVGLLSSLGLSFFSRVFLFHPTRSWRALDAVFLRRTYADEETAAWVSSFPGPITRVVRLLCISCGVICCRHYRGQGVVAVARTCTPRPPLRRTCCHPERDHSLGCLDVAASKDDGMPQTKWRLQHSDRGIPLSVHNLRFKRGTVCPRTVRSVARLSAQGRRKLVLALFFLSERITIFENAVPADAGACPDRILNSILTSVFPNVLAQCDRTENTAE